MMQSLESIPTWFADFTNINLEAAQALLSIVVFLAVLLPTLYLSKGRGNVPAILMFFLVEVMLVGIGWLSFWILIATIALLAFAVALLGSDAVTGA